jgi:Histidine kinase-, DNA gyrase B-, and HSP90-like ATPase
MPTQLIPFHVNTKRVLEVLAKQIYQSPLALLRENAQNAYDAVLMRRLREPDYAPRVDIDILPDRITVEDNGIGMTLEDIQKHFWQAGSSSKNTEEARRAGVVGTFGIGAMANFGIAEVLEVETESAITGQRTKCLARLEQLTFNQNCIETEQLPTQGKPGTTIRAYIAQIKQVNVTEAVRYLSEFVSLLDISVRINGEIVSGQSPGSLLPKLNPVWHVEKTGERIGPRLTADINLGLSQNAEIHIHLNRLYWSGQMLLGQIILRSGISTLRTFRTGFGLATTTVGSTYQFGGIADLHALEPTAGREALTTDSMQLLQSIITEIDSFATIVLAERPECDSSTPFMSWIAAHARYDLCGNLKILMQPGDRTLLKEIVHATELAPMPVYGGTDVGIISNYASEDRPILILARTNPRRQCEIEYLKLFCKIQEIADFPRVDEITPLGELSTAETALAFRIESVLQADYFLESRVGFGKISHGLPLLIDTSHETTEITLDSTGPTVRTVLGLFDHEYSAFGSMVKDFVRSAIFPKVADRVPSSTRQGAEAFLRAIRKPREIFEYERIDTNNLSTIWEDYADGKISLMEAVGRSTEAVQTTVQVVDLNTAAQVVNVVPDVLSNEEAMRRAVPEDERSGLEPVPAISRTETRSDFKLLTILDSEPALRGYRCFLALTEKVRDEMGNFFFQPHRTSIVWGGQKALFIFLHHSGQFGLYYDLQTRGTIAADSGGGPYPTCTIILKDRIYIPIPEEIRASFIPVGGEKKRFDVRCDLLRVENI